MLTAKEEIELIKLLEIEEQERQLITFNVTEKQQIFLDSLQDEVLYGGAAGGGKSYAQVLDAWIYAIRYPGCKQLILRRTFPELKRSLIMTSVMLYKKEYAKYNESDKKWKFNNGSMIEFGYCESEKDVSQYQSAEYDVIRFDELTHFTEFQYTYLISRIRGANNFPKQIKSSTNPGNVGHAWVKSRFIENKIPLQTYTDDLERNYIFIPAKVQENSFLMESDPKYIQRLEQLPENERRALLEGDWDIFEGQYFTEFRKDIHVVEPFVIPNEWRRYITIDYGLDMLAAYWIALSPQKQAYIYKELYQSNLIISEAAKAIRDMINEPIYQILAPPDLWNRRQDTGKSAAQLFHENGVTLIQSKNDRVQGWYCLKEWLKPYESKDEQTGEIIQTANMKIFNNCHNLIRTLPQLQRDEKNPNDVANEPHELTHGPDAIRGFAITYAYPARVIEKSKWPEGSMEYRAQKHIEELIKRKQAGRCELL
jgi:phage terminase large subunit